MKIIILFICHHRYPHCEPEVVMGTIMLDRKFLVLEHDRAHH